MRLAFCLVLAACSQQPPATQNPAELFAQKCALCHGPEGKPDATMVAKIGVRDLTSPELRARVTPALVETQMRLGSQNKLMPSFQGVLSDEQIRVLARYVSSPEFLKR